MQLRDCVTMEFTEANEEGIIVSPGLTSGDRRWQGLLRGTLCSGRSRTNVQWHWEIDLNPSKPGLYQQSFTNKMEADQPVGA